MEVRSTRNRVFNWLAEFRLILVNDEAIIAFWTVQRMGTDDVKSASIRGSAGLFGT